VGLVVGIQISKERIDIPREFEAEGVGFLMAVVGEGFGLCRVIPGRAAVVGVEGLEVVARRQEIVVAVPKRLVGVG